MVVTKLRKVGNSRGVILPAPFLNALNLEGEVEMRMEDGRIILEAPRALRSGWFATFDAHDPSEWDEVAEPGPSEDWEW